MGEIVSIVILGVLVIAQLVERYFYTQQMNQKLSECIKAVMSRNINEYITATTPTPTQEFTQPDSILIDEATDEMFDKFITKQNI